MAIDSPLFNRVTQRVHNSKLPRPLSEDEQAEIAYAWDKLSDGQQEVAARHVKIALRAMGFQVNKADVSDLLQQHGLAPDAGIPWPAFQEVGVWCLVGGGKPTNQNQAGGSRAASLQACHEGRLKHLSSLLDSACTLVSSLP